MKKKLLQITVNKILCSTLLLAGSSFAGKLYAQNSELLNLLIEKKLLTQREVDSIKAVTAVKEQEKNKTFTVGAELKTRTEYRNGYRNLIPNGDTTAPAFFTNQRTRLLFTYEQKNKFILHTSFQDVRVWGQADPRSNNATLQLFEAYAEVFLHPKFSIKLGRQKVALDDQRLFAENDWRVNANAHDAVNFRYNGDKLSSELIFAYNQSANRNGASTINQSGGEPIFNTTYNPGFTTYKTLGVHYFKYKITDAFTLTTINAADGYQQPKSREGVYQRFTDGGRVAYEKGRFYATYSGYYQSGKNVTGVLIDAYYHQAEIKYTIPENFSVRLGGEVMSGGNAKYKSTTDHNFVALYGVAHRFNGNMDFFITFPADLNNAGLINPYLFFTKNAGKKVVFRSDFHLFYSENTFYTKVVKAGKTVDLIKNGQYLGYENDLGVVYTPKPYIKVDLGFSYAIAEHNMVVIKKSGTADYTPTWAYISVTFKPQLFKSTF